MTKKKAKPRVRDVPEQKLRLFVEHYSADPNAASAAAAAGYKGDRKRLSNTGTELLKRPDVRAMLAEVTRKSHEAKPLIMTRDERKEWLSRVVRGEERFEVATLTGPQQVAASPPVRTKALELLGKMEGDFVERHEHKVTGEVTTFHVEVPARVPLPEPDA